MTALPDAARILMPRLKPSQWKALRLMRGAHVRFYKGRFHAQGAELLLATVKPLIQWGLVRLGGSDGKTAALTGLGLDLLMLKDGAKEIAA